MHRRPTAPRSPLLLPLSLALSLCGCAGEDEEGLPRLSEGHWAVHTVCGSGTTVPGVDVSKWQGSVNWASVKASGVVFAIARVSDGLNYPDAYFSANWQGIKQAGLIRGVYQYFRPSQDPLKQADYLISEVNKAGGWQAGDLPPVVDVETAEGLSASKVQAALDAWIKRVEAGTGRRPMIYTGSYFWDGSVLTAKYASYPLWTAHYTTKTCPLVPNVWNKWVIWQYSSKGSVPGVSGNCDVNRFDGDLATLKAFAAGSVIQPPDAAVPDTRPPDKGITPDRGRPDLRPPDRGITPDRRRPDGAPSPTPDRGPSPRLDGAGSPWPDAGAGLRVNALAGGCALEGGGSTGLAVVLGLLLLIRRRIA